MRYRHNKPANILPSILMYATLVACSQSPDNNGPTASNDGSVSARKVSTNSTQVFQTRDAEPNTNGNEQFKLVELTQTDLNGAELNGELGCSFTKDNSDQPILVAQGDVASDEPAHGIVKVGNSIEKIAAGGGFNAMSKGTSFEGKGFELGISLTGLAQTGGESPPRSATLTSNRAGGGKSVYVGRWQCGP